MKKVSVILLLLLIYSQSSGQMVMTAKGVQPDNACHPNQVYFLMSNGAKPAEEIASIEKRLNEEVRYAKENPDFEAKPAINFVVNCKGRLGGGFHLVNKSSVDEFDNALLDFFKQVTEWQPGKLSKKKAVDSWYIWTLVVKDGYITIKNK